MNIQEVQDLISDALQSDLENGVKWLSEMAAEEFAKNYPALCQAIGKIMEVDHVQQEQASAQRRGSPTH